MRVVSTRSARVAEIATNQAAGGVPRRANKNMCTYVRRDTVGSHKYIYSMLVLIILSTAVTD